VASASNKIADARLMVLRHYLIQNALRVRVRLAGVNGKRFIQPYGIPQLARKDLDLPGGVFVI
jgi:hypothetical protein